MTLKRIKRFFQFDTAGWIASASLLICAVSGVLLAIPYDFTHAHQSLSEMLLSNPAGTFIRNLHYWSAQLFFIFSILHVYDHFYKKTETNIRNRRTWTLLVIVLIFLGYEMISGFILKGDSAGIQAQRILASLFESIPFVGKMLSAAFSGSNDNQQVVYIQHVATGTILLFIAVYDHVKTIWPKRKSWLIVLGFLLILSFLFRAPFGMADSTIVKGPWFFVGIQEMLHLTSHPVYVILLIFGLLLAIWLLPKLSSSIRRKVKLVLLISGMIYLVMTLVALLFRGENWEWQSLRESKLSGEQLIIFDPVGFGAESKPISFAENRKVESCLQCHGEMKGLSESHNVATTGCYACHKGDPYSVNKTLAHRNMILVPGNFSNARQTCGTQNCHQDITNRMQQSLMTTQSGIIAIDKFVFGETDSMNDTFHVQNLGHTTADTHLRNLCAGCHLGSEKTKTGNAEWLERGGGCNACHLQYNDEASASMKRMQAKTSAGTAEVHPAIDIQVSNDRCMSCHSRSGRISLSYEGWNETEKSAVQTGTKTKILPDNRVVKFVKADVHHEKGMGCIDCHGSYDVMGDGQSHSHKEQAVSIQCKDCHPTGKVNSEIVSSLPDKESQMIAWLRKTNPKTRVVLTEKNWRPLMNTQVDSLNQITLIDKLSGKVHESKPAASACTRGKGHDRLSCEACHTVWVPQCIGCHNSYEKETAGFDMLTGKRTKGSWVEFAGKTMAEAPVLGVNTETNQVVTAMPGMVMSIDNQSLEKGKGKSFHRLFAPTSGHTTQKEARSCQSCHNNSLAMGFGCGELIFKPAGNTGNWTFEPHFALNENDGLPEDAWIGFLQEAKPPYATRDWLRPFNIAEQKRVLQVGTCLTCHDEKSKVMENALDNWEKALTGRSKKCGLTEER
ncbi:MAG TPA: cytochrome b N-terminal domain-containing protein [Prolixibacteraceae bacterium]|nr:cytochrome b N-terminal domain-containing protein [Prolixibacteraceae bacterium]